MNFHLRFVAALIVLASMSAAHREASAQTTTPPGRPQGLFGGARSASAPNELNVTASLSEGYDSDVPPELHSRLDRSSLQTGGFSTILSAYAHYARRTSRVELGANAASMLRHYAELGETQSVGHSAGLGANVRLGGHTTLFANQAASYSPTYFYGLFPAVGQIEPGDAASTQPDFAVGHGNGLESVTYVSTVTMGHEVGRRRAFNLGGDFRYTDRLHETEDWRDVSVYSFRGGYDFNLTRNSGLTGDVHYRSGDLGYAGTGSTTEIGVQVGWNYTRPLSATRSVGFGMSLGLTGADLQQVEGGVDVLRRRYRATGDARFSVPLGPTWQVTASVRRGLDYVADLPTPVYSTGAKVSAQGLITPRLDVSALAGYSRGASALNVNALQFGTYTGSARIRYAISENVATYGEYLYYYYDFSAGGLLLPPGIPPGLERNGIRVGLTVWVPALRR